MWRGIVVFSALGILFLQQPTAAQETAEQAQTLRLQKFLRLHVTGGRIELQQREVGQSRTVTAGQPESPYRQHLQLQVRPPCIIVEYESIDPDGRLALQLCERRKLTIERATNDPSRAPSVRYEQPQSGDVCLVVEGAKRGKYSASSLWHLLLSQPVVCREHLTPMLEILCPDWQLAEQAAQIKAELLAIAAEADVASDEKTWTRLVDELQSEYFSQRQAADARLRSGGRSAAAFLSRLDRKTLSAEQRLRIDQICRSLADGTTDTPQRVAAGLLGDRGLWLSFLADPRLEDRAIAANHLNRLLGRPVAFDPQADEKTRQLQVAELARRIGVK